MAGPIRLVLVPSRRLSLALAGLHALAAIGLAASLPWQALVPALAVPGVSLWLALRPSATRLKELAIDADGTARWTLRSGVAGTGAVLATACVQPWLTSFCLGSPGGARVWVALLGDEAPADALRRLRVWLRWAPSPGEADPSSGDRAGPPLR